MSSSSSTTNRHKQPSSSSFGANSTLASKNRQYAHLNAQLAQLQAHLADTENIVRMTAEQAEQMRFLGAYVGALFMASAKVLGEESVADRSTAAWARAAKPEEDMSPPPRA
ncbi:hypothetical protein DV738_g3811, partial [Chaetothyriales sp. CBS 135597]